MATIVLSAVGAALGSSLGGNLLGLSMTAVGRFVGASLGRAIDQRIMGQGSQTVETGRVDRFRLMGAGEGTGISQVYGRMRVGGHVIWSTEFKEHVEKEGGGGGKGTPKQPTIKQYSYSISLALALCEGEIAGVSRIWADGAEIGVSELNMRVYTGSPDQLPDPKIEAVEGAGVVPAYRGVAYVVIEDLALERFGNRVPQLSFEVARPMERDADGAETDVPYGIKGVALMPGTGEYALATKPVYYDYGRGSGALANVNSPSGQPDIVTSLNALETEVPDCESVSMIASWFGDDLRCGSCTLKPKVEQKEHDSDDMPWLVSSLPRAGAELIERQDDRPIYGGTPADRSVVQSIQHLQGMGKAVMFYPFILMDQLAGNGLGDPWSDAADQPELPWRGRITLSEAPGRAGSVDGTAQAEAEVAAFFGTVSPSDFNVDGTSIQYTGPNEWSYRRFVLHYAALCKAAGGVDAFCIGSEMRALTQIRGVGNSFPAVEALRVLAGDVRAILGAECNIGYAADWSEYFGYHPQDGSGDVYFHLDPLWADPEIDFIGIDNYMPLSDWRDGEEHADAEWGSIYNVEYLKANVAGGEGYDWYYSSSDAEAAQRRDPITDGAYNEPWVYRYKDIRGWWGNAHHNRIAGVRDALPTSWIPQSKPVWFTEIGCAAIDKGTNQPNKFLDPKSSESKLPKYSNGRRDELIQRQYLQATYSYWGQTDNNPVSDVYEGSMIDMSRSFVWAWDARPYPWFPAQTELWSDGENYTRGHWITGRVAGRSLASVVAEICEGAGLSQYDVSALFGFVRGYIVDDPSDARRALQPLMLGYGFDAIERDGVLVFQMRDGMRVTTVAQDHVAITSEIDGRIEHSRQPEAEMTGRVRLKFVQTDGDFETVSEETVLPDDAIHSTSDSELPLSLTRAEGRQTTERWLTEARVARDTVRFSLPLSRLDVGAGDIIALEGDQSGATYRVDQVEQGAQLLIDAVRVEPEAYKVSEMEDTTAQLRPFVAPTRVLPLFLDIPLLTGDEVPHAPYLATAADPWPGSVAVYSAAMDADYALADIIAAQSTIGVTRSPLFRAGAGRVDRGAQLEVELGFGQLASVEDEAFLAGANLAAIGDGSTGNWEVFQFKNVEVLGPKTYLLNHRLRGQAGSDALIPEAWPEGSDFVLLNSAVPQLPLASNALGLARHFRIGPARRGYDDPSYVYETHAFDGNGLRPYKPVHLKAVDNNGDVSVEWIRRTRIGGDSWVAAEVPVSEESEAYVVKIYSGAAVVREETVGSSAWVYDETSRNQDGIGSQFEISVAQISAIYGAGPEAVLSVSQ